MRKMRHRSASSDLLPSPEWQAEYMHSQNYGNYRHE